MVGRFTNICLIQSIFSASFMPNMLSLNDQSKRDNIDVYLRQASSSGVVLSAGNSTGSMRK